MCSDEEGTSRWEVPVGAGVGLFLLTVGIWLLSRSSILPGLGCLFMAAISFGEVWSKWRKPRR